MLLAGDVQGKPQPDGSVSVSIERTFNEYRVPAWPAPPLNFKTWVRWGYGFAGDHTFQIRIVDANGTTITEGGVESFSLADNVSSYQASVGWEVRFETPGLYFVLCLTDGAISRALPLWVR